MTVVELFDEGERVAHLTEDQARRLVARINGTTAELLDLIETAWRGRAWVSLGYGSWDELCEAEIEIPRLDRDRRREMVGVLRTAGMSTRAIAAATGTSKGTVDSDLKAGAQNWAPDEVQEDAAPVDPRLLCPYCEEQPGRELINLDEVGWVCPDCDADEFNPQVSAEGTPPPADAPDPLPSGSGATTASSAEPPTITGTDGKQYKPTAKPTKPRRAPLPEAADKAAWDARKVAERLERIATDDRFPTHREQVAAVLRGHLTYVVEVCQDLLDGLDTDPQEGR